MDINDLTNELFIVMGTDMDIYIIDEENEEVHPFHPLPDGNAFHRWAAWQQEGDAATTNAFWVAPVRQLSDDVGNDDFPILVQSVDHIRVVETRRKRRFDSIEDLRFEMLKKARSEPIVISVMGNLKWKRGRTSQSYLALDMEPTQGNSESEPPSRKPRCITEAEEFEWEAMGLGCSPTASRLKQLVNKHSPDVLFIQETKCTEKAILKKMNWSAYDYFECVEAKGKSGAIVADLIHWNKTRVGNIRQCIADTEAHLLHVQKNISITSNFQQEYQIRQKLDFYRKCEHTMWAQRAKQLWLKDGDQNTRYFHAMVNLRRKKNKVHGITSMEGNWVTLPEDIKTTTEHYFVQLYQNEAIQDRHLLKQYISNANLIKLSHEHLSRLN
ncbi:Transposon TX1 uncharacterized [Senna tora]|uniref:Transposon TX1 uncharacterized n=1 Tax=Senna tora TaxID=362788 RepID=A0A834TG15_9FABA|nr:Transposon TX1 uncharacterized [Senna tora]